jgi:chromosome segregation ATPase
MIDFESRLNKMEVELASIKEKISFFSVIYEKLDTTLEKVQRLMEDRRSDTNDDLKDVYGKIADTEKKLLSEIQSLKTEMKAQHEKENSKIDDLNKWRWFVMGAAGIIGWIFAKVFGFK